MAVKVKHSVSVQAQEQVSSGERFYQDSDVGGTIGSTIEFYFGGRANMYQFFSDSYWYWI